MNAMAEPNNVLGGLTASAVLVDLNISEWVGRKLDKTSTDKVVKDNHAMSKDAARVTKHLFVDNPKLAEVMKKSAKARNYVAAHTLPWMGSLKLLPMTQFLRFQEDMGALEAEFHAAVDAFLNDYDIQVAAMAFKLGNLFQRSEYPSAGQLRAKFKFSWDVMPLPTSGDFRVEAEAELRASLRDSYNEIMNKRVADSMNLMWGRLKECLEHMLDRLGVGEDGKPNIFRDSMLENAKELVNMLKDFNITHDPEMEQARRELAALIDNVEPQELRKNTAIREEVKSNVADILSKFAF
jgi:hypothetical protein